MMTVVVIGALMIVVAIALVAIIICLVRMSQKEDTAKKTVVAAYPNGKLDGRNDMAMNNNNMMNRPLVQLDAVQFSKGGQPGMPQQGMTPQGMPQQGMPQQGMVQLGMPQQGMAPQGMPQPGANQQNMFQSAPQNNVNANSFGVPTNNGQQNEVNMFGMPMMGGDTMTKNFIPGEFALVRDSSGERYYIQSENCVFGKSETQADCTVLGNNAVSRTHAKITWDNGEYSIEDLQSANGTFVNGNRIGDGKHAIYDGDQIVLANEVFVFSKLS